jgi:aconitate hydratase
VLSGNRNFEGRVNHDVRANYLASPPLVVAYALAGSIMVDLATQPLGTGAEGEPVYLKDIWPSSKQIAKVVRKAVKKSMFKERYGDVFRLYASVKPGITGLWQTSGRNDVTYRERVLLDEFYVRHWSPWLDIYILAKTVLVLLNHEGAY